MRLEFSDYKRGGDLFALTEDQIDDLDPLHEYPLQVWIDGSGCDAEHIIVDGSMLLRVLRAHAVGAPCPPYWTEQRPLRSDLTFSGWGLEDAPKDGLLVNGPDGPSLDVTGYNDADYWDGDEFKGADEDGILPVYRTPDGRVFPDYATPYPYLA